MTHQDTNIRTPESAPALSDNDRWVLSLIRQAGALPKAELARRTRMSSQALGTIVRRLESDGLLVPGTPVRGRIGQPSVPYRLAPRGALSLGVKIGRRSAEVMLTDFTGAALGKRTMTYASPVPRHSLDFVTKATAALRATLRADDNARLVGMGVAMPFELWNWPESDGVAQRALEAWRDIDPAALLGARTGLEVAVANDATAACAAELLHQSEAAGNSFLYIYVGWFIGGGLVLDGRLYPGPRGNAAAIGSMPVSGPKGTGQLLTVASLASLDTRSHQCVADDRLDQTCHRGIDRWIDIAAPAIAQAVVAGTALLDMPCAVLDGAFGPAFRDLLVARVGIEVDRLDRRGLPAISIRPGTLGSDARALGAASLPILNRFFTDAGGRRPHTPVGVDSSQSPNTV